VHVPLASLEPLPIELETASMTTHDIAALLESTILPRMAPALAAWAKGGAFGRESPLTGMAITFPGNRRVLNPANPEASDCQATRRPYQIRSRQVSWQREVD
jgi:hypothetical protein